MTSEGPTTTEGRRLHVAAVGAEALNALRQMALPLLVVAVLGSGSATGVLVYGVAGLVISVFVAWLTWETSWWWLRADEVRLKTGLVSEKIVAIPLERVQAIDTVHGPIQRLFGVVELHVQSAGGGKKGELVLRAVSLEQAEELREAVRRAGARETAAAEAAATWAGGPEAPREPAPTGPQETWRLGRGALLAAALTSGSFGVLLPVVAGASQMLDEVVGFEDAERLVPHSVGAVALIAAIALGVAWVLSIAGTLVAFAGFTAAREGDRLRIQRGFLERRVASVPVARVHAVRVVESLLRQPFGLATVRIETAGYAEEAATAQTLLPLVRRREADALVARVLPELAASPTNAPAPLTGPPPRALRRYVTPPAAVALIVGAGVGIAFAPVGLLALALLLPAVAVGVSGYRAAGWARAGDLVVLRSRTLLGRTTATADARRLQRVRTTASPFQRRAALADVQVSVSSGRRFGVRHLGADVAGGLRDDLAATSSAGSRA